MEDKLLGTMRVTRLGKLLCNMALFCGIVLFLLGLVPVLQVVYYLFAMIITIFVFVGWVITGFLAFNIMEVLQPIFDFARVFVYVKQFTLAVAPYMCAVAAVGGILSIPLIMRDKSKSPTGRIVAASIALFLAALGTILVFTVGVIQ